jgi:SET domain-containing protein 6
MLRSQVVPVVQQNPKVFYPDGARELGEEELLALAHRMGSTIMSYAFDLANEHEEEDEEEDGWVEDREGTTPLGMVPMADILNANAEFNAHVNHGDSLEVTSLRSTLPAGSEVLNYYGPLPTSELLRRYGYVTPEHHRYDVVELPWSLVREALIQELGLSNEIVAKTEVSSRYELCSKCTDSTIGQARRGRRARGILHYRARFRRTEFGRAAHIYSSTPRHFAGA